MPVDYDFYSEFMRPAVATAGIIDQGLERRMRGEIAQAQIAEQRAQTQLRQADLDQKMREEAQWNKFGTLYADSYTRNKAAIEGADIVSDINSDPNADPSTPWLTRSPAQELQNSQAAHEAALNDSLAAVPPRHLPTVLDRIDRSKETTRRAIEVANIRGEIRRASDQSRLQGKLAEITARFGNLDPVKRDLAHQQFEAIRRDTSLSIDEKEARMDAVAAKMLSLNEPLTSGQPTSEDAKRKLADDNNANEVLREMSLAEQGGWSRGEVEYDDKAKALKFVPYNAAKVYHPTIAQARKKFLDDRGMTRQPPVVIQPGDTNAIKALPPGTYFRYSNEPPKRVWQTPPK